MAGFRQTIAASALLLSCTLGSALAGAQQTVPDDAGCVQQKDGYVCNWASFKGEFDRAHTVAVNVGPMDRSTARELRMLVGQLGKTETSQGQPADLMLTLMAADPTGITMGPGDHDVATLRIYAPSGMSPRGKLLWAETLRGQGDQPWPAQVHALIAQFQQRFQR